MTWRDCVLGPNDLTPTQRLVAVAVAQFMDSHTLGSAFPGCKNLKASTGLSERSVYRALEELCEKGWLIQHEKGGTAGGVRRASTYQGSYPQPLSQWQGSASTPCQSDRYPLPHVQGSPATDADHLVIDPDIEPVGADAVFVEVIKDDRLVAVVRRHTQ